VRKFVDDDEPALFDRLEDLEAWLAKYRTRPHAELGWIEALITRLPSGHVTRTSDGVEMDLSADVALDLLWNVIQVVHRNGVSCSEALQQIRRIVAGIRPP
jgi:hypothetical protein